MHVMWMAVPAALVSAGWGQGMRGWGVVCVHQGLGISSLIWSVNKGEKDFIEKN